MHDDDDDDDDVIGNLNGRLMAKRCEARGETIVSKIVDDAEH